MGKRILRLLCVSCFALSAVLQIHAQQNQIPVHDVFRIRREAVKPGRAAAHQRHEAAVPATLRRTGSRGHYMAMSSLTGPSEVWFIRNYPSFAGWERTWTDTNKNEALRAELDQHAERDSEFLTEVSEILAFLRKDLSRERNDLTRLHYFGVTTIHVRPGHEDDFTRLMKMAVEDCQRANANCYWSTYQVTAGMPSPTFLVLTTYKNLAELDAMSGAWGEAGQRAIARAQDDGYAQSETQIFKVEPSLSYVVPEGMMEERDPEFWGVKAPATTAPARKK
jgi:hypothetical protein